MTLAGAVPHVSRQLPHQTPEQRWGNKVEGSLYLVGGQLHTSLRDLVACFAEGRCHGRDQGNYRLYTVESWMQM